MRDIEIHDPTLYRYLVSHSRDRSKMTVRRVYQKGDLLLECEKEFVDLTKTPDAKETDMWNCTFRMSGHRMNVCICFDNMVELFNGLVKSPRGSCKASKEVVDKVVALSNQGMYNKDIAENVGVSRKVVYSILKYMLKKNQE